MSGEADRPGGRGTAEVVDLAAVRRARNDERRLTDLQLALLQKARRLRRRSTVRP